MHRTLDELAAEVRPMVFRLLDAGRPQAAAALVETYTEEADAAFWFEVLASGEVQGGSVAVDAGQDGGQDGSPGADALEPTDVQPVHEIPAGPPAKKATSARGGGRGGVRGGVPAPASGSRARATVTR
jgi:hypothetical protein